MWDSLTPSRFWTKQWRFFVRWPTSRPASPSSSRAPDCPARPRTGSPSRSRDTAWSSARRTARGSPGPALAELGRSGAGLAEVAGRHLVALRDSSGESSQFYVREGGTRVCVAAAERTSGLRDTVPVGARLPMTAGSAAHALLAFAPADEVTRLLPNGELHGPHPARRPPARVGAQHRRAGARRRLPVGAGAEPGRDRARRRLHLRPGRAARPAPPSPEIVGAVLDAARRRSAARPSPGVVRRHRRRTQPGRAAGTARQPASATASPRRRAAALVTATPRCGTAESGRRRARCRRSPGIEATPPAGERRPRRTAAARPTGDARPGRGPRRTTALPPKPPARPSGPRARRRPAPRRRTRRAPSVEISKSSRSDACPSVSTGPDRPRVPRRPRRIRHHLEHPGVLGDDVPRPAQQDVVVERGQAVDVGDVPERRHPQARPPPARTPGGGRRSRRRRACATCRCRRRAARARAAARSSGTCSVRRSRVSRNSAAPAVHSSDADWSRIPVGAPTKSFSDRRASSTRSVAGELGRHEVAQRQGDRAGQRRRRRQPGAHGDVGVDQHAHAAGQPLPQPVHHAGRVARPAAGPAGRQLVDGQLDDARRRPAARPGRSARRSAARPRPGSCAAARSAARSRRCSRCARR